MTAPTKSRQRGSFAAIIAAAAVLWLSSRVTWITASTADDKAGAATRELSGGQWAPELTAIALGLLAGVGALSIARGWGARALGAVLVVLGILGTITGGALIVSEPSPERVRSVVVDSSGNTSGAGTASGRGASDDSEKGIVPAWATVTNVDVSLAGPIMATIAGLLTVLAGAFSIARPRPVLAGRDRFDAPSRPAVTPKDGESGRGGEVLPQGSDQTTNEGWVNDPDRDMWERLDIGDDPTQ